MEPGPAARMRAYLQRIATGPQLSKDLTADETADAIETILRGGCDPVQMGVFLIALRMKRETVDENVGALRALRTATAAAAADVDDLADLGDPYDGFARHLPASPFLPAVLAACGLPAVLHGARELPPKRGVTAHRILAAAGVPVELSPAAAAARIADPACGWAYVDVTRFCPGLAALDRLRELIVKRPLIATLEKLCGPVRARRNHLVVGYVHREYDELLVAVARAAGYTTALAIKGVEGGIIPSLTAATTALGYSGGGEATAVSIAPADVGIAGVDRAAPIPEGAADLDAIAAAAADAGRRALAGEAGPTRDMIVHAAATVLAHAGISADRQSAAARVRAVLGDGAALGRFER
jgi:anthranilate phosphoribosyltransferase